MQPPSLPDIASPHLARRHQPSGLNTIFRGGDLSFADYAVLTRDMLREAHARLGTTELETVVAGNMPSATRGLSANGILPATTVSSSVVPNLAWAERSMSRVSDT